MYNRSRWVGNSRKPYDPYRSLTLEQLKEEKSKLEKLLSATKHETNTGRYVSDRWYARQKESERRLLESILRVDAHIRSKSANQ